MTMLQPLHAADLPTPLQESINAAIEAGEGRHEQCPIPGEVSSLAQAHPDLALAIAEVAAERLRIEEYEPVDSPCVCVTELALAIAPANPAEATDIRKALIERFPECDDNVTSGLEETLAATSSGAGHKPRPKNAPGPRYRGGGGDDGGGCKTGCAVVEPGEDDAVSRTKQ